MAIYPAAQWRPLAANVKQPRMTPRVAILHTAVDAPGNTDLWGWFTQSGLEAHFFVHNDGTVTQYMDTGVVAEANYKANGFAISIETEDDGNPRATPWNTRQLAAIVALLDWVCTTHKIPRRQADRWDGSGIGWHSMWGLNTKANPGVNPWTNQLGKDCPTAPRIAQVPGVIAALNQPNLREDDDMNTEQNNALSELWSTVVSGKKKDSQINRDLGYVRTTLLAEITGLRAAVEKLAGAVAGDDLTADQLKQAVKDAIAESVVKVDVSVAGGDPA